MALELVQVKAWARLPWLRHGFSTRAGGCSTVYLDQPDDAGELNLGFTAEDQRMHVARNRELLSGSLGVSGPLATVRQVHGYAVQVVRDQPRPSQPAVEADGIVTATAAVPLGILTADCVPVLLADTRRRVVGAVHAGWRGSAAQIAARALETMQTQFGCAPGDLIAAVGPSIGPCCYRVGEELRASFAPDLFTSRPDGSYLDLWEANRRALLSAGLLAEAIHTAGECTVCTRNGGRPKYFSHRADRGRTGRMMAAIAVVPAP